MLLVITLHGGPKSAAIRVKFVENNIWWSSVLTSIISTLDIICLVAYNFHVVIDMFQEV